MRIHDPNLQPIWAKVQQSERLTLADGLTLFQSTDLLGLGAMADWVKRRRTGNRATFVVNRQINPTNVCVLSCRFCDYATKEQRPGAYILSKQQILAKLSPELREVHVVSGLYKGWTVDEYLDILRAIRDAFPQIQVKAYTAVEIDFFARRAKTSLTDILQRMIDAGVVCLPGGGAEVFSERVRKALFPFKIGAPRWLEIHREAHRLGLRSNATLLYGHIETYEERVLHMLKLRELQDETHGFLSFIPLAYQPGTTKVVSRQASAIEDLKTIAVSRLMLDNFDHVKAYWVTMSQQMAALALHFGADDVDGTIGEERIMHAAMASSPVQMARQRLADLIAEAGLQPVERDCLYNLIEHADAQPMEAVAS